MDLQDFESQQLYFDTPMAAEVSELLTAASKAYASGAAEPLLLRAYSMAPENLSVLVGLYRFYYYQHRYFDAIVIAQKTMQVSAGIVGFPEDWSTISSIHLANAVLESFTMVRFYLLALKGCAYLHLRSGQIETGIRMLNKVIEMDSSDRLGAKSLLQALGPAAIETSALPRSAII